jgi:hypothetical protein
MRTTAEDRHLVFANMSRAMSSITAIGVIIISMMRARSGRVRIIRIRRKHSTAKLRHRTSGRCAAATQERRQRSTSMRVKRILELKRAVESQSFHLSAPALTHQIPATAPRSSERRHFFAFIILCSFIFVFGGVAASVCKISEDWNISLSVYFIISFGETHRACPTLDFPLLTHSRCQPSVLSIGSSESPEKQSNPLSPFSLVLRAVLVTREVAIAWVVAGQTLVILTLTWAAFDTIMGHLTRLKMLNSLDAHDLQVP